MTDDPAGPLLIMNCYDDHTSERKLFWGVVGFKPNSGWNPGADTTKSDLESLSNRTIVDSNMVPSGQPSVSGIQ